MWVPGWLAGWRKGAELLMGVLVHRVHLLCCVPHICKCICYLPSFSKAEACLIEETNVLGHGAHEFAD